MITIVKIGRNYYKTNILRDSTYFHTLTAISNILITAMLSRIGKEKKNTESKKVHRRVCTEADELYPLKVNKPELKRNNEKTSSKPKFIDVCSKYMAKDVHVNRELHPRDYRVIRDKDR